MSPLPANLRQHMVELVRLAVDGVAEKGGLIHADVHARRLLAENPGSPMSHAELSREIAAYAVIRGVGVELGEPEPK